MGRLEAKHEFDIQQVVLDAEHKKEIELNKLNIANKEKQKYFFIGGLLLLATIGCLLFYESRNRKKTNENATFRRSFDDFRR